MTISLSEKRFFFILLGVFSLLALLIIKPFFSVIMVSIALAVIFTPTYEWLNKHITFGVSWLSALITVLLGIMIIATPLFFIGKMLLSESQDLYTIVSEGNSNNDYLGSLSASVNNFFPTSLRVFDSEIKDVAMKISQSIGSLFAKTISTLFSSLLVIIAFFYFLKDGKQLNRSLIALSPLSDSRDKLLLEKIHNVITGVLRGYFLVGIVQGALLGLGFYIFGVPSPVLWGTIAAFASLIPTIGTAFVSIPAIIYLLVIGSINPAIGLIVWATLIVGLIDNVLNPFVVGKKINVPPLFILFSVLGGISLFGAIGVLAGPIIVGLLYEIVALYRQDFIE